MTPSQIAKKYGAKQLKDVAEFHGITPQALFYHYKKNAGRFESMCWEFAKSKSDFAELLTKAFVEGCECFGESKQSAEAVAKIKGYKNDR